MTRPVLDAHDQGSAGGIGESHQAPQHPLRGREVALELEGLSLGPLEKLYFDASLYFANWLFVEVAFRYSKGAVDMKALRRYAGGHTLEIRSTARDVIVAFSVEGDGESFDTSDDGSSWLSSLIALRADIAGGDDRALYLGWLVDMQCGEIDDDVVEPARPEGLGNLSPALVSLVDIFGLDGDLVAAAAEGAPQVAPRSSVRDIDRWLTGLDPTEHVALLARVARGDGSVGAELMRRFRQHTKTCDRLAVAHGRGTAGPGRGDRREAMQSRSRT